MEDPILMKHEAKGKYMGLSKVIAESNKFIVLDKYIKIDKQGGGCQTESDLERERRQKQYEYYREKFLTFKVVET